MKTCLLQIGFIAFFFIPTISNAQQFLQKNQKSKKYNTSRISGKEWEEKRIADSIRVADSLAMVQAEQQRIADSIARAQYEYQNYRQNSMLPRGVSQRVNHDERDQTPPFIPKRINASGYLQQGTKLFNPEKISDGNLKTWWTPSPNQSGLNSWITFSFATPVAMNCLKMINGSNCDDPKIGNLFYLNNRLKSANLYFSDGSMVSINLDDDPAVQTIAFNPVRTSYVKMIVQEVYPGTKWNDLSIPEIHFFNLNGLDLNNNRYYSYDQQNSVIQGNLDSDGTENPDLLLQDYDQSGSSNKNEIFTTVEEQPSYPGGEEARIRFLQDNIRYPAEAKELGIQGKVFVTFVVERDGSKTDVRVLRGIGGGCDEESIRVVKAMPRWIPGKQRGEIVRVQFNLPIKFTLQ